MEVKVFSSAYAALAVAAVLGLASCGKGAPAEVKRGPLSVRGPATLRACEAVDDSKSTVSSMVSIMRGIVATGKAEVNQISSLQFLEGSLVKSISVDVNGLKTSDEDINNSLEIVRQLNRIIGRYKEKAGKVLGENNPGPALFDGLVSDPLITSLDNIHRIKCGNRTDDECVQLGREAVMALSASWDLERAQTGCSRAEQQSLRVDGLLVQLENQDLDRCETIYNQEVSSRGAEFLRSVKEHCKDSHPEAEWISVTSQSDIPSLGQFSHLMTAAEDSAQFVCRAKELGRLFVGKSFFHSSPGWLCNHSVDGKGVVQTEFEVMKPLDGSSWVPSNSRFAPPPRSVIGVSAVEGQQFICRASNVSGIPDDQTLHVGRLILAADLGWVCSIEWGGLQKNALSYEVLVGP